MTFQTFCESTMERSEKYEYHKAWKARNPEKVKAYAKAHYERVKSEPMAMQVRRHKAREKFNQTNAWLNGLKSNPCMDCGQSFPPECMDFDHVTGNKEFNISAKKKYSRERLQAEIDKCELVCANCHRIRSTQRRG